MEEARGAAGQAEQLLQHLASAESAMQSSQVQALDLKL